MVVKTLSLTDFRNYTNAEIAFFEGVNLIYGKNAHGKTNILEALWLFTGAKSFRTNQDSEMIRFSASEAHVKTEFSAFSRAQTAEITISGGRKKLVKLGGAPLRRTSEILGQFPAVIFSPDELHIITGAPEVRRRFMDSAISAAKPLYYSALHTYIRNWKQKNALLKNNPKKEELTVWNEKMAEAGARVMQYRSAFFESLAPFASEMHRMVAGKDEALSVLYAPSAPLGDSVESQTELLYTALMKKADAEMYAGLSLVGPHRDEIRFLIDGKDARAFASQGQMRTAAVSVKVAEGRLFEEETGEAPAVFLDDILGELDRERRTLLLESLAKNQVLLTCTEREAVTLSGAVRYFEVLEGTVCTSI